MVAASGAAAQIELPFVCGQLGGRIDGTHVKLSGSLDGDRQWKVGYEIAIIFGQNSLCPSVALFW